MATMRLPNFSGLSLGPCRPCVTGAILHEFDEATETWQKQCRLEADKCSLCQNSIDQDKDIHGRPWIGDSEDAFYSDRFWIDVCKNGHCYHKGCLFEILKSGRHVDNLKCPDCKDKILFEAKRTVEMAYGIDVRSDAYMNLSKKESKLVIIEKNLSEAQDTLALTTRQLESVNELLPVANRLFEQMQGLINARQLNPSEAEMATIEMLRTRAETVKNSKAELETKQYNAQRLVNEYTKKREKYTAKMEKLKNDLVSAFPVSKVVFSEDIDVANEKHEEVRAQREEQRERRRLAIRGSDVEDPSERSPAHKVRRRTRSSFEIEGADGVLQWRFALKGQGFDSVALSTGIRPFFKKFLQALHFGNDDLILNNFINRVNVALNVQLSDPKTYRLLKPSTASASSGGGPEYTYDDVVVTLVALELWIPSSSLWSSRNATFKHRLQKLFDDAAQDSEKYRDLIQRMTGNLMPNAVMELPRPHFSNLRFFSTDDYRTFEGTDGEPDPFFLFRLPEIMPF
jgi:hypothetical protein